MQTLRGVMSVPRLSAMVLSRSTRPAPRARLMRLPCLTALYSTRQSAPQRARNNVRRVGQVEDAGSLQNLLRRVMEFESEVNPAAAVTEFKPHTQKCTAYCTAEEYSMPALKKQIAGHAEYKIMPFISPDMVHIQVEKSGEVFAFSNGTFVTWAVPDDQAKRFLNECILAGNVQINPHSEIETEDAEFAFDEDEVTNMKGDIILLNPHMPSPTLSKISFSHGLARSAKLAILENMLETYLSSTKRIPTLLLQGKKIPLTRKEILRKLGELLSFRQQLNLSAGESFLDTPDFYWARPELEEYYNTISRHLDVRPRIAILNKKLDYANELATMLREHLSEKHSLTLEWMIIILITVEVGFEVVHWLRDSQNKPERASDN